MALDMSEAAPPWSGGAASVWMWALLAGLALSLRSGVADRTPHGAVVCAPAPHLVTGAFASLARRWTSVE